MSKYRVELQLAITVEANSAEDVYSEVEEELLGVGDVLAVNSIVLEAP